MKSKVQRLAGVVVATCAVALAMGAVATTASASEWTRFQNCPTANTSVFKCIYSETHSGKVVLGSKSVPIVNTAVIQGGIGFPDEETSISKFYGATNGVTLSKAPQPVPGGLAGLVNCKEISNFLLKAACEWTFENGLTGVNATLELARPAEEIQVSEYNLALEEGLAFKLPVKVKLENPFLGSNCYVGSSSNPLIWNLTTGVTTPPGGATPMDGSSGIASFLEEFKILKLDDTVLVENNWSAPGTSGCGGALSFLLDPIVSAAAGVPAAAGKNSAELIADSYLATRVAVINNK